MIDAFVVVADVKVGDSSVVVGEPQGIAHRRLDPAVALEVRTARTERQLLLQARFVQADDLAAVFRPAHVVVGVFTPVVQALQWHRDPVGSAVVQRFRKCDYNCISINVDTCEA